jgi:ATP-dependent Clp protease protease subunit
MVRDPEARSSSSNMVAGSPVSGDASLSSKPPMMEQVDEKGRPCMSLPRLNPLDCYWIYNPDGYFRVR